ncbi:MAG: AraC family transcriptional regulator ligand-binding domain-containing protein [Sphaerochaetaceae bacterium]|nr:AraC family transcriptional regulator ligand-binding domain-containing protein [Sphaerochaetaceae bacterium]
MRETYFIQRGYFFLLQEIGVNVPAVLKRSGLPESLFTKDHFTLSQEHYCRLWKAIEEESRHKPSWVIDLLDRFTAEVLAPPLYASLSSQNLKTAIQRIATYKSLIAPMLFSCRWNDESFTLRIDWHQSTETPAALVLFELLFVKRIAEIGTRTTILPMSLTAVKADEINTHYGSVLQSPVFAGPINSITFAHADVLRPFVSANDLLWKVFEPELQAALSRVDGAVTMRERVKGALRQLIPSGQTTVEAASMNLNISVRTLQRKLQEEGTSFRTILYDCRVSLARMYGKESGYTRKEIAYLLGYADTKSLDRLLRTTR